MPRSAVAYFESGVGVGTGSGSGTGVGVTVGDGDGVGVGVGVSTGGGVSCVLAEVQVWFASDSCGKFGWPLANENDKSPIEAHSERTAAVMATRVFI